MADFHKEARGDGKRLEPETLEFDRSGHPYCRRYADTYASRDGALGQARHVFLAGNDLPRRWAKRHQFVILETGFGLGTNFLATWQAWREDPQRPQRLHFVSVERHPVRNQDLASPTPQGAELPDGAKSGPTTECAATAKCPSDALADLRAQLAQRWPLLVAGVHRIEFDEGRVVLTLALGDVVEMLAQLQLGADAFFLDGFAPDRNPRMWDRRVFRALARLARPDSTAATYSCARVVREGLGDNGFVLERRPGFGSKREMLAARFAPRWKLRRHEPPASYEGPRHAIVVGAGLAGCASTYALRRRGWHVTLLERAPGPACQASGLPAGLLRPLLSADDNHASRLSRAGYLFGLQLLQHLASRADGDGHERLWSQCGVFEQAGSAADAQRVRESLARQAWPAEFAMFLDAKDAAARVGMEPRYGGTWFARGAIVAASRWCRALLTECAAPAPADAFAQFFHFEVAGLTRLDQNWRVCDGQGRCHEAPIVVLANAMGLADWPQFGPFPLQELGGCISLLSPPALRELRAGISGDGYAIPPLLGPAAVGATYEAVSEEPAPHDMPDETPLADRAVSAGNCNRPAHDANLRRLSQLLAMPPNAHVDGGFGGRRCVSKDHLPLAGTLPDSAAIAQDPQRYRGAHLPDLPRLPRLYCLSALGSRGMTLAPLLAEYLASLIAGEPPPIEAALSAAVDPARFLLRSLR